MTQLWPATDEFRITPSIYQHTSPMGWSNARPNATQYLNGVIHNGYKPQWAGAAALAATGATSTAGLGFSLRRNWQKDVRADLRCYMGSAGGTPVAEAALTEAGLILRKQYTTAPENGDTLYQGHVNLTAYVCKYFGGPSTWRFRVSRYNNGVETVLSTSPIDAFFPGKHRNPFLIRAQVVNLSPTLIQIRMWGQFLFDTVPIAKITITESTGSGINAAGDAGFTGTCPRVFAPSNAVMLVPWIEFHDSVNILTTPHTLQWREEWIRRNDNLAQEITDLHGVTGRTLHPFYTSDIGSRAVSRRAVISTVASGRMGIPPDPLGARSRGVNLNGAGQYLEVGDTSSAFGYLGTGKHQFAVAVWATIEENRDGNELFSYFGRTSGNFLDVFMFGLREASPIGSDQAATLQFRCRSAEGSGTFTEYDSDPFVIEELLGRPWCFWFSYEEGQSTSGLTSRVRVWHGADGASELLATFQLSAAESDGLKLYLDILGASGTCRIGIREGIGSLTDAETYLKGTVDRVEFFADPDYAIVPGGDLPSDQHKADAICDPWQKFGPRDTGSDLSKYLRWRNGWNFENEEAGVGAYAGNLVFPSVEFPTDQSSGFMLAGASASAESAMPVLPPRPVRGWSLRQQLESEGGFRKFTFRLLGVMDRVSIWVRGNPQVVLENDTGYRVDVMAGTPAYVRVYRVVNGVEALIGYQDPSVGTANVALGVDQTLAAEAYALPGTGPTGPAGIKVWIDDLLVPISRFGFDEINPGIGVTLDGVLVDYSPFRLTDAFNYVGWEGVSLTDGLNLQVDTWTITATPTVSGDDVADTATMGLGSALDGLEGSLADVIGPSWRLEIQDFSMREEAQMETGRRKRARMATLSPRVLNLRATGMSSAEEAALDAFWSEHGTTVPFLVPLGTYKRGEQDGSYCFLSPTMERGVRRGRGFVEFAVIRRGS